MEELDYYTQYAHEVIAKGYISGGITELKRRYPQAYASMEEKLEKNWNKNGIDTYCNNFINGLKAVSHWKG